MSPVGKKEEAKVSPLLSGLIGKQQTFFVISCSLGGVVGAIEISCTYPTEYVKTCMQLDKAKQKLGAFGVIGETFRTNGFLGFYRGYSSLLIFNMPKNSVRFYTYEWAATNLFKEKSQRNNFLCGLVAGATEALLVVTP
jgi:solute carrier family 25 citrate transporter 1